MAAITSVLRLIIFTLIIVAAAHADYLTEWYEWDLNVAELTSSQYTTFLATLRKKLSETYVARNIPVLPVFDQIKPPQGFDLVLTDGDATTTVRFRRDNLYLIGYKMGTGTGTWYEFGREGDRHWINTNSKFLGFGGGYDALEKITGEVTGMVINQEQLIVSVRHLARSNNRVERAKALVVLIQMFSEAARFLPISAHFASNFDKKETLPEWMMANLEKNWEDISIEVLKWDADPSYNIKPMKINEEWVDTMAELRPYLGILFHASNKQTSDSLHDEMMSAFESEARSLGPQMVAQA